MNPHSYRLKGRDFVHQGKIEIDVNERAVFLSELKAAFSFTPTPIVSLTVLLIRKLGSYAFCKGESINENVLFGMGNSCNRGRTL